MLMEQQNSIYAILINERRKVWKGLGWMEKIDWNRFSN
jgi:hypothetical protein